MQDILKTCFPWFCATPYFIFSFGALFKFENNLLNLLSCCRTFFTHDLVLLSLTKFASSNLREVCHEFCIVAIILK